MNMEVENGLEEDGYSYSDLMEPSGLGGWLILVQIGLYATLLFGLVHLFLSAIPTLGSETWDLLTTKGTAFYHVLWWPTIIFELVDVLITLAFIVYVLVQFYQKKSIVPRLMIILYVGGLVLTIIDYVLLQQIPMTSQVEDGSTLKEVVRGAMVCAIWIPYFIKSVRVRKTFVN